MKYINTSPQKFPLLTRIPANKNREISFGWSFGIWPLRSFVKGFERFAFSGYGIKALCVRAGLAKKRQRIYWEALEKYPLSTSYWTDDYRKLPGNFTGRYMEPKLEPSLVAITELREDRVTGITQSDYLPGVVLLLEFGRIDLRKNPFGGFVCFQQTR